MRRVGLGELCITPRIRLWKRITSWYVTHASFRPYFLPLILQLSTQDKISRSSAPPTSSPSFAHKRIDQLEQAVRSLIVPTQQGDLTVAAPHSEFRINRWGSILKGQEAHQRDRMHGDPLPGGEYSDESSSYNGVLTSPLLRIRLGRHASGRDASGRDGIRSQEQKSEYLSAIIEACAVCR